MTKDFTTVDYLDIKFMTVTLTVATVIIIYCTGILFVNALLPCQVMILYTNHTQYNIIYGET